MLYVRLHSHPISTASGLSRKMYLAPRSTRVLVSIEQTLFYELAPARPLSSIDFPTCRRATTGKHSLATDRRVGNALRMSKSNTVIRHNECLACAWRCLDNASRQIHFIFGYALLQLLFWL